MKKIYSKGIETSQGMLLSFMIEHYPDKAKLLAVQKKDSFVERRVRRIANECHNRNLIEDLEYLLTGIDLTQSYLIIFSKIIFAA